MRLASILGGMTIVFACYCDSVADSFRDGEFVLVFKAEFNSLPDFFFYRTGYISWVEFGRSC